MAAWLTRPLASRAEANAWRAPCGLVFFAGSMPARRAARPHVSETDRGFNGRLGCWMLSKTRASPGLPATCAARSAARSAGITIVLAPDFGGPQASAAPGPVGPWTSCRSIRRRAGTPLSRRSTVLSPGPAGQLLEELGLVLGQRSAGLEAGSPAPVVQGPPVQVDVLPFVLDDGSVPG